MRLPSLVQLRTSCERPFRWLATYLAQSRAELIKVTWPDRRSILRYSAFVIGTSLVLMVIFAGFDWLLTLGLNQLLSSLAA